MRVNLASVDTPAGPVTVIRPVIHEPGYPGVKFHIGVRELADRRALRNLRKLGASGGVALWEAEWVTSPLDVRHSPARSGRSW